MSRLFPCTTPIMLFLCKCNGVAIGITHLDRPAEALAEAEWLLGTKPDAGFPATKYYFVEIRNVERDIREPVVPLIRFHGAAAPALVLRGDIASDQRE